MVTPVGSPAKPRAAWLACSKPGVSRRKPVGRPAQYVSFAPEAQFSNSITDPFSRLGRDGQTSPLSENGNFHLRMRRLRTRLRVLSVPPTLAVRPVTSFMKARPARRAFVFLSGY